MANNSLFKIDALIIDGAAVAFEDGSGEISGAASWEFTVVPSASGDDFQSRKRVPRTLKAKMQFGPDVDLDKLTKMTDGQITGRDTVSGRRALMPRCSFGSMGSVGAGGAVDMTFNILAAVQWL